MWREQVHILLIKPGQAFDAPFHRLRGDIQPRRGKRIAQEVKAPADPADEGLVGVLQDAQARQRLVDQAEGKRDITIIDRS